MTVTPYTTWRDTHSMKVGRVIEVGDYSADPDNALVNVKYSDGKEVSHYHDNFRSNFTETNIAVIPVEELSTTRDALEIVRSDAEAMEAGVDEELENLIDAFDEAIKHSADVTSIDLRHTDHESPDDTVVRMTADLQEILTAYYAEMRPDYSHVSLPHPEYIGQESTLLMAFSNVIQKYPNKAETVFSIDLREN